MNWFWGVSIRSNPSFCEKQWENMCCDALFSSSVWNFIKLVQSLSSAVMASVRGLLFVKAQCQLYCRYHAWSELLHFEDSGHWTKTSVLWARLSVPSTQDVDLHDWQLRPLNQKEPILNLLPTDYSCSFSTPFDTPAQLPKKEKDFDLWLQYNNLTLIP